MTLNLLDNFLADTSGLICILHSENVVRFVQTRCEQKWTGALPGKLSS